MTTKRKLPKNKVRVTFTIPALDNVEKLAVVGDFNHWNAETNPMTRAADGWTVGVTLDGGKEYQYRFFDGKHWHDDPAPDGFVVNEHGSRNAVLNLTESGFPAPKAKSTSTKTTTKKKAA